MMKIEPGNGCPLDGFKPCRQLACAWFTQIRGTDPQTGQDADHWGCAVAWLPVLNINTANEARQTAAAVESFRNTVAATETPKAGISPTSAAALARTAEIKRLSR